MLRLPRTNNGGVPTMFVWPVGGDSDGNRWTVTVSALAVRFRNRKLATPSFWPKSIPSFPDQTISKGL